jgi:hypothetical protein
VLAAAFLGFDGAALGGLGLWAGNVMLVVAGLVLFASSGLVLLYWRWHLRQLSEITAGRRALRAEAEEMRRLLEG